MPERRRFLLRGGSVVTRYGVVPRDVLVVDGVIDHPAGAIDAEVIDCSDLLIGPGFVDIHVHFREPGQEWKEDVASGSAAAATGGFTAVVPMANTEPATDTVERFRWMQSRAESVGLVEVMPAAALTVGRAGCQLPDLEGLYAAGVRIFSDDGDSVGDPDLLHEAMRRLAARGGLVAQHAEDRVLAAGGHMHAGRVAAERGIAGLAAEAEVAVVERDLGLVRATGVRYHVQHASVAGTVELIREAKAEGLQVTAEAAPHHLMLDETDASTLDPNFKMYPPLRTPGDVEAVRAALADGTIDAVATDHAPHSESEKSVAFEEAPRGVIGVETAAAVTWTVGDLDPVAFFERMSRAPARIAGFDRHGLDLDPGEPANLVVFDPSRDWIPETFVSKSSNCPFRGRRLRGRVMMTVFEGAVTYDRPGTG